MSDDGAVFIGRSARREELLLRFANRHGLITGATGTGKTVTLQILAEGFSDAGVPVFAADMKGDLRRWVSPRTSWSSVPGRSGSQREVPGDLLGPVR